jgi:hypothetical protein
MPCSGDNYTIFPFPRHIEDKPENTKSCDDVNLKNGISNRLTNKEINSKEKKTKKKDQKEERKKDAFKYFRHFKYSSCEPSPCDEQDNRHGF